MRLHHLSMTAFGPFADTVEVDFDELSAGGLFLLTGATGAGKTSVLDAVCFALYGQVPGDRAGARHLRSDHAAVGVAPVVVLRLSIGDRTFRFTRSPAWSRPKQRGTGETKVQAHVVVEERRGDDWVPLAGRLDDAGLLVSDLLGMTAAQFTQVAMLPQGRFQAFLRASSTDRHAVLQKLFRTDRFEQVERWLVDQRGAARRASEAAEHEVLHVLHRFQEVADTDLPAEVAADLAGAAERGEVVAWASGVVAAAAARRDAGQAARHEAEVALKTTEEALAEARRLHDLRLRSETAAADLVALAARSDELAALHEQLVAHRRAAPLSALVERTVACRRTVERAQACWDHARSDLGEMPGHADPGEALAELHREAVAAHALAVAFRPRVKDLATLDARGATIASRASALAASLAALDEAITRHPVVLDAARTEVEQAQTATATLPTLRSDIAVLHDLLKADRRLDVVTRELATARIDLADARDAALAAKEHYLGVREARINGMAAELAGALAVGCACPVCGSASHPAPATVAETAVGRTEEDSARKLSEDLAFAQQNHEVRVGTLEAEQGALAERLAEVDRASLPDEVRAARARLDAAQALAGELDERTTKLSDLQRASAAALETRGRAAADLAATRQEASSVEAATVTLTAELEALVGGFAPDLETLIEARGARCEQLRSAIRAFTAYDEALRAASEADDAAQSAAESAGFTDRGAAEAALLAPGRAEEVEATLTRAEAHRLAAEQVLGDPAVRAAATAPLPDLDVAVVHQRHAAETVQSVRSAVDAALTRSRRLDALHARVLAGLEAWRPLRERHDLVAGLSQLVEGKGPDNPLRIRLAAYVLSERLRQVVAAANERLARMTGQRYALEHTDDRGAGEQRGGLSLRVRDDWNGVSRDPATLSGGETFVVSLALALGLADTVAHEAGGTDIDTLFIDEGFGSLDTDTLEDVMDTLDSLRDGGRVVGLVSHVPELRSRITTQLEVAKGRTGSTLRPVLAAG